MKNFFDPNKDILELMAQRHSVRVYKDKKLSADKALTLQECIDECVAESGLTIYLVKDEPSAFSNIAARYGHFEGVKNYIVLAGPDTPDLDEKCGYYGERLVLLAQQLKLNTCWVALTFSKRVVKKQLPKGVKLCIVISIGYGEEEGRTHKTRKAEDLSNMTQESPLWFKRGMEAALLAPTAINQQSFYIELLPDGKTVSAVSKGGPCSNIDLGIVKHDFELAAGSENFVWA